MKKLQDTLVLRHRTIRNRICVPPMVTFIYNREDGSVTDECVAHYQAIAAGKPGLLILEAVCVNPDGRLHATQIGIWDDSQIPGLARIAAAAHAEAVPIVAQIHHSGVVGIAAAPVCPSAYVLKKEDGTTVVGTELSPDALSALQQDFIQAGRRAYEAGFDGVELHGCHAYLLSQFLNRRVNTRIDAYGADVTLFVTEIMQAIREATSDAFLIGIRLGAYEPTLEDGIRNARALEDAGIDFLDISYGFFAESEPWKPDDFPFADIIHAAGEIRKAVSVPVFAVNGIRTPDDAQGVLDQTDVDMVDIGRSVLVDPDWPKTALAGGQPGTCLTCRRCTFIFGNCPGRKLRQRKTESVAQGANNA